MASRKQPSAGLTDAFNMLEGFMQEAFRELEQGRADSIQIFLLQSGGAGLFCEKAIDLMAEKNAGADLIRHAIARMEPGDRQKFLDAALARHAARGPDSFLSALIDAGADPLQAAPRDPVAAGIVRVLAQRIDDLQQKVNAMENGRKPDKKNAP